jgi:hypothetical protein
LYQACQERVTHLQICLETPVKLTAAIAPSRLFSVDLLFLTTSWTSAQLAPTLFRKREQHLLGVHPGLTILEILGEISLDRCLDFRSLLRLAPPSTLNSTLFLPTNRELHAVFLLLAHAVTRFRSRPTLKLSTS